MSFCSVARGNWDWAQNRYSQRFSKVLKLTNLRICSNNLSHLQRWLKRFLEFHSCALRLLTITNHGGFWQRNSRFGYISREQHNRGRFSCPKKYITNNIYMINILTASLVNDNLTIAKREMVHDRHEMLKLVNINKNFRLTSYEFENFSWAKYFVFRELRIILKLKIVSLRKILEHEFENLWEYGPRFNILIIIHC